MKLVSVKLCMLLASCSPRCPDTREIMIGLKFIILATNCMPDRVMIVLAVLFVLAAPVWPNGLTNLLASVCEYQTYSTES